MKTLYDYNGISRGVDDYATPEMYGAVGNGVTNDAPAIQAALNRGGEIRFKAGATYKITSTLRVSANTVIDLNGATLMSTDVHALYNFLEGDSYGAYNGNGNIIIRNGTIVGGCVSFIHGEHIALLNLRFQNNINDHCVEIASCKDYIIDGCSFIGMVYTANRSLEYINIDTNASYPAFPHNKGSQSDATFYDMSTNKGIVVRNCYFALGEGDYAYGFNAIGVHSRNVTNTYADDVTIVGNTIVGFTGCGLRVNAMRNAYIAGNNIMADGDGIRVGDVADCDDVVIVDNYVTSANGSKLSVTSGQCPTLTVSGNVTQGYTQEF